MTSKQNPKFQELVAKLREIFQIDRPELDFGIYRILNARGEINDYLQNRLAEKVQAALSTEGAEHENAVFSHLLAVTTSKVTSSASGATRATPTPSPTPAKR